MRRSLLSSCTIASVVALTFSGAVGAQSTSHVTKQPPRTARPPATRQARPATHIPVTKHEVGGEVELPARGDTAATVAFIPSDTLTRPVFLTQTFDGSAIRKMIDTITMVRVPGRQPYFMTPLGPLYASVAAGASIPSGDIYNGYNPGMNVTMSVGVESMTKPMGLQLDLAYDQIRGRQTFRNNGQTTTTVTTIGGYSTGAPRPLTPAGSSGGGSTGGSSVGGGGYTGTARIAEGGAQLWSAMLDGRLRLPFTSRRTATEFYAVAGGGVHYFRNYSETFAHTNPAAEQAKFPNTAQYDTTGAAYASSPYPSSPYNALTRLGANAGLGMQWMLGGAALFVESRYVTIFTKDRRTSYWPVVLGVTSR